MPIVSARKKESRRLAAALLAPTLRDIQRSPTGGIDSLKASIAQIEKMLESMA